MELHKGVVCTQSLPMIASSSLPCISSALLRRGYCLGVTLNGDTPLLFPEVWCFLQLFSLEVFLLDAIYAPSWSPSLLGARTKPSVYELNDWLARLAELAFNDVEQRVPMTGHALPLGFTLFFPMYFFFLSYSVSENTMQGGTQEESNSAPR